MDLRWPSGLQQDVDSFVETAMKGFTNLKEM